MSTKRSYTLPTILLVSMILSGLLLSSSISYATDTNTSQDNVSVNVPVSCTMNGTGMSSHTASIPNGTYQADIGTTTLQSFCNDSQGFAIYAIGYTNEEYGNTNLVGLTQNQTIITGTATSTGNPDVSNWAVKLATSSGATYPLTLDNSFGAYSAVPTTYTKVAHRDSGTDLGSSATGSTLTTTYAAYISKTQAADTYNGKVKYTLVHPASEVPAQPVACEAGKICYNPNSNTVVGEMGKQNSSSNVSKTLWEPNYKRQGYGFAGWNTAYDYSGTNYGPNESAITPSDTGTNGFSLYAIWVPSAGSMQNWNGCSSMNIGDVTALTDNRDNNTYAIAKLVDGKCWMIENLRLDDSAILSSSNTNNPSLPLNNSWYYKDSQTTLTTSNHLSPTTDPTQITWCSSNSSSCMDQSMVATNNTTLFTNNTASSYDEHGNVYSHGNYYNWYSATAGNGKYGNSGANINIQGDICPIGWRVPRGGNKNNESNNDYWSLIVNGLNNGIKPSSYDNTNQPYYYGSTESSSIYDKLKSYPNNYITSGYIDSNGIYRSASYYWTSTGNYSETAYYLSINSSAVIPGTITYNSFYGYMVRCLANT